MRRRLQQGVLRRCSRWLGRGQPPLALRLAPVLPGPLLRGLIPFWLFERSCRPHSSAGLQALLQWIHSSACASPPQRQYALVALAYRAVDADDAALAADCLRGISALLADASERCQAGDHQGSNRENPVKWLVSLHTTAYHLGLVLDQRDTTMRRLDGLDRVVSEAVVQALEADVACRLTSNLMRGLSLSALDAWQRGQTAERARLGLRLKQLERDLHQRHANHPRQMFHQQVAESLLQHLQRLETGDAQAALQELAEELVRSSQPALKARLIRWFIPPGFSPPAG